MLDQIDLVIYRDVLREIAIDEVDELCKEFGISIVQKAKIKAAVKALQSQSQNDLPPV